MLLINDHCNISQKYVYKQFRRASEAGDYYVQLR